MTTKKITMTTSELFIIQIEQSIIVMMNKPEAN